MKKIIITAAVCAILLGGCMEEQKSEELVQKAADGVKSIIAQVSEIAQGEALSREKHGYGQGVELDEKNRPLGALDFNKNYGSLDALAINENDKRIELTFDQGYENGYTEKILDTLKEKNVKATFFLVGDYAEKNPELVKRMIADGHTVGNHTQSHYSMPDLTAEETAKEIGTLHDYVKKHFGYEMDQLRPPMGEFSEVSLSETAKAGYTTKLWSFAYRDWLTDDQPDPAYAKEKLIGAAHEGAIYLLHSVSSTNAEVLGDVIDGIREKGFEFFELK
mgnify:CR=1 FL=1